MVCGVDEVGRGAWAGPLAVGIAIAGKDSAPENIRDSKALTEKRREAVFAEVADWCAYWSVGFAEPQECDSLGMSLAQKLAASRALENLGAEPDWALIDGNWNFLADSRQNGTSYTADTTDTTDTADTGDLASRSTTIIKGDTKSLTIAAASILAKVTRDRLMREIGDSHGPYRFSHNKGYPCAWHKSALGAWGATPIHRKTWKFMEEAAFSQNSP